MAAETGVCQDFAHILLVMLRYVGIPARYVSGYICPKNHELRGEGATHAWVEAYIPFHGWMGFDPTNNCIVSDRHVKLAIGRSFTDCTPVKGTYKGSSEHKLEVSVVINNSSLKNGILTIMINRPEKLNALNKDVFSDLNKALDGGENNPEIKSVIITGAKTQSIYRRC
ncbi:MAG: enoyl-CoA hydratase/isomerase family protein [Chitinophagaceae bacterium]|nr:enoyl-CoA hydratase/isomerase family protein [Chitinophagaceae bacterium]